MPIYDFQCTACGFQQELMRKVSAPSVEACPQCQQQTFSKQVSAPNFQLTGSGWYATDFKTKPVTSSSSSTAETATSTEAAKCNPGCACH